MSRDWRLRLVPVGLAAVRAARHRIVRARTEYMVRVICFGLIELIG